MVRVAEVFSNPRKAAPFQSQSWRIRTREQKRRTDNDMLHRTCMRTPCPLPLVCSTFKDTQSPDVSISNVECDTHAVSCKVALDRSPMFAPGRRWVFKSALKRFNQTALFHSKRVHLLSRLYGWLVIRVRDLVATLTTLISGVGPKRHVVLRLHCHDPPLSHQETAF